MKKILLVVLMCCLGGAAVAQFEGKPKLVVGIIVDQMRQDYIHRYWDRLGDDGLKMLVSEGYEFKNAHYNYVPTYTGPGHASVYTGTTPSRHGIIANSWYSRSLGRQMYCAEDSTVQSVGASGRSGEISAFNLKSTTITDELRIFSNDRSKVVGVAIKDRGSALPAGHNPTAAYWYHSASGDFISSTYYTSELPPWVKAFNERDLPQQYASQKWELLLEPGQYMESTVDDTPYERPIASKETPTLPYDLSEGELNDILSTPYGNTLTLEFALAALENEDMGADGITDFLAVSFSSPDIAGHAFGPRAIEIEDLYLRFDKDIARLLKSLNETVGEGEYVVFLTADHGVADVPAYYVANKYPGGYFNGKSTIQTIAAAAAAKYGVGNWVLNVSNNQVFLNRELIASKGLGLRDVQAYISTIIQGLDFVSEVLISEDLKVRNMTDPFIRKFQNGYNTDLSGDLLIVPKSGYLSNDYGERGTSHGSGYNYDTQVPIIFYGKDVPTGSSVRNVSITDIAPTISMMLDVPLPSAATGTPLIELFE